MGTRVIYAMSRDRLFFHQVTRLSIRAARLRSPLLLSALVGVIFAIGKFERVIAMLAFFFVTNYMLSFISLFLLRVRNPDAETPLPRLGLSLDHRPRPPRLRRVSSSRPSAKKTAPTACSPLSPWPAAIPSSAS